MQLFFELYQLLSIFYFILYYIWGRAFVINILNFNRTTQITKTPSSLSEDREWTIIADKSNFAVWICPSHAQVFQLLFLIVGSVGAK